MAETSKQVRSSAIGVCVRKISSDDSSSAGNARTIQQRASAEGCFGFIDKQRHQEFVDNLFSVLDD